MKKYLNGKIICTQGEDLEYAVRWNVTTPLGTKTVTVTRGKNNLEEKAKEVYHQQLWNTVLDTVCRADEEGNRMCDYGCNCNRCGAWEYQAQFAKLLKEEGLDYSFYKEYLV